MNTDELLVKFRENFFSVYFTSVSDILVKSAINEIVSRDNSETILSKCPKKYVTYINLSAMLLLHSSGIKDDNGGVSAPDLNTSPELIVQSDKVADTSRTFFKPEKSAEGTNGILTNMRKQISDIEKDCLSNNVKSRFYGLAGGSNYTHQHNNKSGCGSC